MAEVKKFFKVKTKEEDGLLKIDLPISITYCVYDYTEDKKYAYIVVFYDDTKDTDKINQIKMLYAEKTETEIEIEHTRTTNIWGNPKGKISNITLEHGEKVKFP